MNNITLIGRLTKAPEARTNKNGNTKVTFTLAVDRNLRKEDKGKGYQEADFIFVEAWGYTGQAVLNFSGKGKRIAVQGQLRIDQNREQQTSFTKILANQVEIIDFKEKEEQKPFVNDFEELDVIDEGRLPF